MQKEMKWLGVILLVTGICLGGAVGARAELQRIYADAFPCETIPPKCPEVVGFLMQIKNLFPESIELAVGDRFDLDDGGLCDDLYVEAAGGVSLPVAGLNAELFLIRPPASEWQDHLAMNLQINDFHLLGEAILFGHGCLGFLNFGIPLGGEIGISIGQLLMAARYSMWLDTDTNKVVLQDEFADVQFGNLDINTGGGALLDGIVEVAVVLFLRDVIAQELLVSGGALADLTEGIMDGLYHTQPCGCMMLPSHGGKPPAGHILVNMAPFLLPLGLVAFLRRRARR